MAKKKSIPKKKQNDNLNSKNFSLDKIISKDKVDSLIKKASKEINKGKNSLKQELKDRGITEYVDEITEKTIQSDTGKKLTKLTEDASEQLDKLSGKKILELVEKRLSLQDQYNDILATKLDEALTRLSILES